jgi:hypothetical protein
MHDGGAHRPVILPRASVWGAGHAVPCRIRHVRRQTAPALWLMVKGFDERRHRRGAEAGSVKIQEA